MKLAKDWISEHGPQGDYPLQGVPIGCFTEAQLQEVIDDGRRQGMLEAARMVEKLAAHLVGNEKSDGTRDQIVYEQGIGCERAVMMLDNAAKLFPKEL